MRSRETYRLQKLLLNGIIFYLFTIHGLNADTCNSGCPNADSGILQYVTGNVYEYSIDSFMSISVSGNDAQDTALKISGLAKLYADGNCGYTLQLDRITVSAVKESIEKQITQSLSKPIKFTMVSGELQPAICADPTDTIASLNIKRGIISLLQASDKPVETDVFGVCPTVTSVSKTGSADVISKVRNLNNCRYREQTAKGFINGIVDSNAGITSSAILNADYAKELKLVKGIPANVQLVEDYQFAGMPSTAGVAKAKVRTTLKLGKVGKGNSPTIAGTSNSIIFEQPTGSSVKNIAALKKVFTNTVNMVNDHVQGDAAQHFSEVIRMMRSSDTDSLIELSIVPHANKVLARKVYLDALFRVGTSNAVKAIVRQIPKMSEAEKTLAFLSLNLVKSVEKDALNQASALLNPNAPKEAFLAVGNLINKYCKQGTCDQSEVNVVSKRFADSLKHCKANTKKDEDRFIYILKGIRNSRKFSDPFAQVLGECALAERSARLRVAALQAFSASNCDAGLQANALSILKNRNEDSEIRIEAYLALIACPSAQLANEIAEIVNSEPVYQVGGFISSNLKAIRDSTDATRAAARHFLGNIRVTKKFPIDPRRYSFNSEMSYAIESLGVGASVDYNLIYSQKGFLPRSGRLNLTSEIFGTNFNILEVNMRQENLEEILGYYLGPKGFIKTKGNNLVKDLVGKSRSKRSVADDTEKFAKNYKSYGTKSTADVNLDLALRVFGSELFFLSLADDVPQTVDDILAKLSENAENIKNNLKKFEIDYNWHTLFIDAEFVYPTGIGLPLELSAQGTSAVKLSVGTEVDLDTIVENPKSAKYRLKIVPSVDVNVNGQMRFNTLVLVAGVRLTSSLHSATGSDVNFELLNDGAGFSLDVAFPRNNLQLVDFKHNVDLVVAEQDKEVKVMPLKLKKKKNAPKENCFDQLHYIGMTVCFTSVMPDTSSGAEAVGFPLSGPMRVALRLETEKKINILGSYEKNGGARVWKLNYSTPGSQVPHDTELKLQIGSEPKIFARASLQHPEFQIYGEAGLQNDDKEISVYGSYGINGDVTVQKIGLTKSGNEYRPLIEVKNNNKGVSNELYGYQAGGRILKEGDDNNMRLTYENLEITNKDGDRIIVNGWTDINPFNSELKIQRGEDVYEVKSHFTLENNYSTGLFIRNMKSPNKNGASVSVGLSPLSIKTVIAAAQYNLEMSNELDIIRENNDVVKQVKFKNDINLDHAKQTMLKGKLNGEVGPKLVQIDMEAINNKKQASVALNLARDTRVAGDYSLDINAKLNKHFVDIKSKLDIKGIHFLTDNSLSTSWGTQLTVKGEVGQRFSQQDIYIDVQGTFVLTSKDKKGNWLLKVIGTPDKTNCDFKLTRDGADLITIGGETTHPQDKLATGKMMLQVKDLLNAKADLKINKAGKGDLTALVNFKKAQRKINLDSKFTIAAPKYEIETTVTYDTDKKIFLKTENIIDKTKLSSKSLLDINGDKVQLEGSCLTKGEWRLNGELEVTAKLVIPNGRQFEGGLNRKVTTAKNGITQGRMSLKLADKLPTNEKRTAEIGVVLEKYNSKTKELVADANIVYTDITGKSLSIGQKMKNSPLKENAKSLDWSAKIRGEIISQPIDVALLIDEYSSKHAIFHATGKYGDIIDGNLNVKYNVGGSGKPTTYELQASVAAPQSSFKTFSLSTSGKVLSPEGKDGTVSIELLVDQQTSESFIKLNTFAKGNQNQGSYGLDLSSNHIPSPLKLDGSYSRDKQDGGSGSMKKKISLAYGDKSINSGLDLSYVESESANLNLVIDSTFESIRKLNLIVSSAKIDDTVEVKSELQLNDQKYMLESMLLLKNNKRGAIIKATLPQGVTSITGIVEMFGERRGKLIFEIKDLGDLNIDHSCEVSLKAFDDFYITAHTTSAKLGIDNFELDARTQPNANGNVVQLKLQNSKGVILAGSATYTVKKEKNKTIVEGQGQVQYYQNTNTANFKIIHQLYDTSSDNEVGFSFTINGTFGPKNAVSTLKVTNKNFQAKVSVCEEKKQCTNVEIRSIVTLDPEDVTSLQHDLMILIDLRELGYPHEFELQSKSSGKGLKFNNEIESSIISGNNIKYKLVASILPQRSKIQLNLPNREMLIETEQTMPQTLFGNYQSSITFYVDRLNKPQSVTKLIATAQISGKSEAEMSARGEIRFENPNIRPLSVSGLLDASKESRKINAQLILDIFKTSDQKIIASSLLESSKLDEEHGFNIKIKNAIKTENLNLQYESSGNAALSLKRQEFSAGYNLQSIDSNLKLSGSISGSKDRIEVIINGLNGQILNLVTESNLNKFTGKLSGSVQLLAKNPLTILAEIEPSSAKLVLKQADLFDTTAEVKLGKEAKLVVKDGGKKLLSGRIALDAAHFLTVTSETNSDDIKNFLESSKKQIAEYSDETKGKLEAQLKESRKYLSQKMEQIQDSVPDFDALQEDIKKNVDEILKELENDPAIAQFIKMYRNYFNSALKFYNELSKTLIESYKQISESIGELSKQIESIVEKNIIPMWKDFEGKLSGLLGELQTEIVKLLTNVFEQLLKSLKSFESDLKAIGKPVYEALKPISDSLQELLKAMANDWEEFLKDLKEYWSKLPTFEAIRDEIKEQLVNLKIVDKLLLFLRTIIDQINTISASSESSELATKLYNYLDAKLRDVQVNDIESLEDIYNALIKTLHSLWKRWTDLQPTKTGYLASIPFSTELFRSIPDWISFRFSVLNFIMNEKLEEITSIVELLMPPFDFLPLFNLAGHITDGKNIITFDGRQFAFQGSCKYMLVQDAAANEFSAIGTVKDGKLKTITLIDGKNFVEISDAGALKLNGKSTEFPVHSNGVHAWKRFHTLRMRIESGVEVICSNDLKVCHVIVDGFFTSKTRGLLGNGNNEPYDDFTLVDGKIAENYVTFVNEYGLGNCPAISATDVASVVHDPICSELFGLDSSLILGYLFMDHKVYREACDTAVLMSPENKEEVACNIALTYASAAVLNDLPAALPNRCLKCAGAPGQREINDEFSVKIPTNKADIVFVVDLDSSKNIIENLVNPTIAEMRNQLKARGLTDTQIIVIAYKNDQVYPALLTSNGGKMNFNGKLSNVELNGPSQPKPMEVGVSAANNILTWLNDLQNQISPQADEKAFRFSLQYPFRAGAAKAIVAVRKDALKYSNIFKVMRAYLTDALTQFDGASLHMIAPVEDVSIESVPTEKIVGFNTRIVATVEGKDAKKRQKLKFKNDMGIDFIMRNNGWVFVSQNFEKISADDQKKAYLNQVTSSIADTLFKTDIVSDCRCEKSYGLHAEHKCSIKTSTFVPNKRPKGA